MGTVPLTVHVSSSPLELTSNELRVVLKLRELRVRCRRRAPSSRGLALAVKRLGLVQLLELDKLESKRLLFCFDLLDPCLETSHAGAVPLLRLPEHSADPLLALGEEGPLPLELGQLAVLNFGVKLSGLLFEIHLIPQLLQLDLGRGGCGGTLGELGLGTGRPELSVSELQPYALHLASTGPAPVWRYRRRRRVVARRRRAIVVSAGHSSLLLELLEFIP
mmetsp:Transcript_10868/g.27973  ORF Transcript_10868/g.27973 Transcript_10868/m.27973 type:complete len:220 (-) Transcript_10868:66-725(-)